jgi:enoyl-CoA hydratase/carnithine racemase
VWNGPAIGAGAELLLAADLRVVGPAATMAFPEVGDGELPCWGGTQRLTRAGGVALALQMLVVGDAVDAEGLARSGLAVLDADPEARADALARVGG